MAEQSKTVDAALSVLAILSQGEGHCTAASLARSLRLSRTAAARLLSTLEAHDLARRTARGWGLGLGLLALAANVEAVLRDAARPELAGLAERFGETALLAVREGDEHCTAASLARSLRLSRTAAARLLSTLEAHDLARRTERGWGLGLGLLALAANVEAVLRDAARPELDGLAERFGETALLAVREGDEAVAIDQVLGGNSQIVQVCYRTGTRHPLDVAAHGRALLDGSTQSAGPAAVVSEGELEPGVRGVAAAIVDLRGRPIASIGLVAPVHRFPPERAVADAVQAAAARVSRGLAPRGGSPREPTGPIAPTDPTDEGGPHAVLPAGR
ncbi:MAG: IclR family transcriptional regulator domain-containing protein [Acidimicrobiales bacterium]